MSRQGETNQVLQALQEVLDLVVLVEDDKAHLNVKTGDHKGAEALFTTINGTVEEV